MEMRTVIPSGLVLLSNRNTPAIMIMQKNVVYNQEHTPSIVNVLMETDGMVDMWKLLESDIAMTFYMDRIKQLQLNGGHKL